MTAGLISVGDIELIANKFYAFRYGLENKKPLKQLARAVFYHTDNFILPKIRGYLCAGQHWEYPRQYSRRHNGRYLPTRL